MRRAKALKSSYNRAIVNVKCRNTAHSPNEKWIEREKFTGNTDCTSIWFSPAKLYQRRDTQLATKIPISCNQFPKGYVPNRHFNKSTTSTPRIWRNEPRTDNFVHTVILANNINTVPKNEWQEGNAKKTNHEQLANPVINWMEAQSKSENVCE